MSFKTEPLQTAPANAAYARYPLVMHLGEHPNIRSRHVKSVDEEADAIKAGWSHNRPHVPEPEPEKPVLTLEDRVAALEATVAAMSTPAQPEPEQEAPKRGPGRPKKGDD